MEQEVSPGKPQGGVANDMRSMDYFKVYEEAMASDLTPAQLHGVIGTRFLNKWKGNIVKSRLIAQGYNQK
eukprot:11176735-Lingulodinium_polyedra.AAC.1